MNSIVDGFKLMAIGMGMVFIFLVIMVFVISFMAKLLAPFANLLEEKTAGTTAGTKKSAVKAKSDDIISAIVAAVHKYRSEH